MSFSLFPSRSKGGLIRAAQALSAANGVAHVVFLSLFGWRFLFSGPLAKMISLPCAILALVGLAADIVGWSLVKHGGKTRVTRYGLWAVAGSTAVAAVLLVMASLTG
jgi:hypothetical protein